MTDSRFLPSIFSTISEALFLIQNKVDISQLVFHPNPPLNYSHLLRIDLTETDNEPTSDAPLKTSLSIENALGLGQKQLTLFVSKKDVLSKKIITAFLSKKTFKEIFEEIFSVSAKELPEGDYTHRLPSVIVSKIHTLKGGLLQGYKKNKIPVCTISTLESAMSGRGLRDYFESLKKNQDILKETVKDKKKNSQKKVEESSVFEDVAETVVDLLVPPLIVSAVDSILDMVDSKDDETFSETVSETLDEAE